jgi:hypothetical protein
MYGTGYGGGRGGEDGKISENVKRSAESDGGLRRILDVHCLSRSFKSYF